MSHQTGITGISQLIISRSTSCPDSWWCRAIGWAHHFTIHLLISAVDLWLLQLIVRPHLTGPQVYSCYYANSMTQSMSTLNAESYSAKFSVSDLPINLILLVAIFNWKMTAYWPNEILYELTKDLAVRQKYGKICHGFLIHDWHSLRSGVLLHLSELLSMLALLRLMYPLSLFSPNYCSLL